MVGAPATGMLDSLLIAAETPRKILAFTVPGIHTEKLGSANQIWDQLVVAAIRDACGAPVLREAESCRWFVVHARWFAESLERVCG